MYTIRIGDRVPQVERINSIDKHKPLSKRKFSAIIIKKENNNASNAKEK